MIRVLINVVFVVGLAVAAIGSVVLWPRAFDGILPASMLERLAEVGLGEDSIRDLAAEPSGDFPADFLVDGPDGMVAP